MNPELAQRLRRYGDAVDQAAVAAGAPAGPLRSALSSALAELEEHDEPVDLAQAARVFAERRRYRRLVAAAAAAVIVVGGAALVTVAANGPSNEPTAASNEVPASGEPSGPRDDPKSTVTTVRATPTPSTLAAPETPTTPGVGAPSAVPTTVASGVATTVATSSTAVSAEATTAPAATEPPALAADDGPVSQVCPSYTPNNQYPLQLCNSGPAVRAVQARLSVDADGYFGPSTRDAVEGFQRDNGLEVDGLVGRDTWRALGLSVTGVDDDGNRIVDPYEVEG